MRRSVDPTLESVNCELEFHTLCQTLYVNVLPCVSKRELGRSKSQKIAQGHVNLKYVCIETYPQLLRKTIHVLTFMFRMELIAELF